MFRRYFFVFCLLSVLCAPTAFAAEEASPLPERIVRPMRAIDPMTLRAEGVNIRLWGIKPAQTAETPLELKALDLMDNLILEQQVGCRISGGAMPDLVGRCATHANTDLALSLLGEGFAVVDRRQTYDSVFAQAYEQAQESARLRGKGVWRYVNAAEGEAGGAGAVPAWLRPHMGTVLPLALVAGPFCGLLVVALVMFFGLRRIAATQETEIAETHRKEEGLQSRERQVLVSVLEGELEENRNKTEAFIAIYSDMLRSFRDTGETPKYRQSGDIIQRHPAFSRAMFEANADKLSLLGIELAGKVSKLYAAMPEEQEYVNLEPDVGLETAEKLVEKVLAEARAILPHIDEAGAALRAAEA